ncbi:pyridoxamine 5'-phosphate oxidase family protein [Streptomyces sp. NPDC048430]|uniref:pyridoxamine 5'-phosphate oxidase family protein n=1 Tax=Streptomyces sp. NPDC048430 TaxID=3155388 RepID=UPI003414942B
MSELFNEEPRKLLDGRNFATVATLTREADRIHRWCGSSGRGTRCCSPRRPGGPKARNLERDPRVSLTVFDTTNPYQSVDIRGTVELVDDPEKSLPRKLSRKYLGEDPPAEPEEVLRLIVRVTPQKVSGFSVRGSQTPGCPPC